MRKEYEQVLNTYRISHSAWYCVMLRTILKKLPPPSRLSREWILHFLSEYENKHTRSLYLHLIKAILKKLGKENLVEGISIKKPKTTVNRNDLISYQEYSSLLTSCANEQERAMLEFLYESGCRAGELLNLTIKDVSLTDDFVLVTLNGKTGQRTIPLVTDTMPNFLYHIAAISEGRVFPIAYRSLYKYIKNLFIRAGITPRKRLIHIFRHSKATRLVEDGLPESLLRQFMGWTAGSNMVNVYVHLSNRSLVEFFRKQELEIVR